MTTLPDCMMPDGADPCAGYQALAARVRELEAERDHALKAAPAEHERHLVTMAERDALRRECIRGDHAVRRVDRAEQDRDGAAEGMMISPHFVCLSMIVSRRAWDTTTGLTFVDCLAYAIERENDPPNEWPPLVKQALALYESLPHD